jgi:branched-chain amino acid transport system substrate-binding protein
MRSRNLRIALACVAGLAIVAGCSSSKSSPTSSGGSQSAASGDAIKVGFIVPLTGSAASGYPQAQGAVNARIQLANDSGGINGRKIQLITADDQSTPQGALAAAKKLVQHDKVFAIVTVSPEFFGAAAYTTSVGVPVLSYGTDGNEYADPKNTNLFGVFGSVGETAATDLFGQFFKSQGATKVGVVGYASSPSSTASAKNAARSAKAAGLQVAYENESLAFGTTDVGPIVLAMKNAGVDAVWLPIIPNTAYAILAALKQNGVTLKSSLLPTGYGSGLLSSAATVDAAQGVEFDVPGQPVEMNTPATKAFQAALSKYAKFDGIPGTNDQYASWSVADLFIWGYSQAGQNPSQADYIKALRATKTFDAGGLLPKPTDFTQFGNVQSGTTNNCIYVTKLVDKNFELVPNATPVCGQKTVS